jgi:hypothetical protein
MYADWLEERGDPRGEFIRVQIALTNEAREDWLPQRAHGGERARRVQELLDAHRHLWEATVRELGGIYWEFRRGFIEYVSLWVGTFLEHADALFRAMPIRDVCLSSNGDLLMRELASSPHLARLRRLNLESNGLTFYGAQVLATSPHLAQLTELRLNTNGIGDAGVRALAASSYLRNLRRFSLLGTHFGDEGAAALAASPHLGNLISLDLRLNRIGRPAAEALRRRFGAHVQI